jgi:hypothetical protein
MNNNRLFSSFFSKIDKTFLLFLKKQNGKLKIIFFFIKVKWFKLIKWFSLVYSKKNKKTNLIHNQWNKRLNFINLYYDDDDDDDI